MGFLFQKTPHFVAVKLISSGLKSTQEIDLLRDFGGVQRERQLGGKGHNLVFISVAETC